MNATPNLLAEGLPRWRFSVADVERMVEVGIIAPHERLEVLDGDLVLMSPKGNRHEDLKVAIAQFWGDRRPESVTIAGETGLRLGERTYLEPDFIVFSRAVRRSAVKGPDILLAVEVADSSIDYDLNHKPLVYAMFGVRELWVVDAARREVVAHRGPTSEGYSEIVRLAAGERLTPGSAPPELGFALDELPEV